MSDILIPLAIYLIGVLISMTLVAYVNKDEGDDGIPEAVSVFSWLFVIVILVVAPISYIILQPFEKLQKYLNNKFRKK